MITVDPGKGIYGRLPAGHEILKEIEVSKVEYDGMRWQNRMAQFVLANKFRVVVETGVQNAVSTDRILRAMEQYEGGMLYSTDPHPMHGTFDLYGDHPNWRKEKMFSLHALPLFFMEAGPFDLFIHDSDHSLETQTYEYSAAWGLVKPGGYIASDDWTWSGHDAWRTFCSSHRLHPDEFGACQYVRKPLDAVVPEWNGDYCERVIAAAYALSQSVTDRPAYFR